MESCGKIQYMRIEMFSTQNKLIAVTKIENIGTKKTVQAGFARTEAKVQLVETTAIADAYLGDGEMILAGSKIVFMGEAMLSAWNKQELEFKGVPFVLAPVADIVMVREPDPAPPAEGSAT